MFEEHIGDVEGGAAFSAYVAGEKVADLWAGSARPERPWTRDTLVLTFSVAAWHAPSKEIQPRSGEPGQSNCKR